MFVNDPADRVAQIVRAMRPVADEVVVAVDSRVDPAPYAEVEAMVDRFLRAEWPGTLERALPWLHDQCHGEWILRLDGDELPSQALVDGLIDLDGLDGVMGATIRRAWLWGDGTRVLASSPWWPDPQLRLVANRPDLVRFPDLPHHGLQVDGPVGYLDEPIYHAALLAVDPSTRRSKALGYEHLNPGLRAPGGVALNGGYYVPEVAGRPLRELPVGERDRESLAAFLHPRPPRSAPVRRPVVELAAVLGEDHALGAEDDGYQASITFGDGVLEVVAGSTLTVGVRVKNLGRGWWHPEASTTPTRLGSRWRGPDGDLVVADGLRDPLPGAVEPGAEVAALVSVPVPAGPAGAYQLEVDLVHEHVRWFGCTASTAVEVRAPVRLGVRVDGRALLADRLQTRVVVRLLAAVSVDLPEVHTVLVTGEPAVAASAFATHAVDPAGADEHPWDAWFDARQLRADGIDVAVASIAAALDRSARQQRD